MADRQLNAATTIYADFPGLAGEPVNLVLTDPLGVSATIGAAVPRGDGRYTFALPSSLLNMSGFWIATWVHVDSGNTVQQQFTVGEQPVAGMTKWNMRIQVARRAEVVVMGRVSHSTSNTVSDNMMIGGADEYSYWYLMLPNQPDAGRIFRVRSWNGSSLELSDSFIQAPPRGSVFALFKIDPLEIDQAIEAAISELSALGRIPVDVGPSANLTGLIQIPRGVSHVYEVWDTDDDTMVGWKTWAMRTGRRVVVPTTNSNVRVRGLRDATVPVWEDSIVDTPTASTIARAAITLHSTRAAGPAIDVEEHLRRQIAAQDEFERVIRRTAGRLPAGIREVMN